jgi:hypothetical protein
MARCPAYLLSLLLTTSAASAQVAPLPPAGSPGAPGVISQAPPRDTVAATGTARIRGRVVAADTGLPLRKAQVRAFAAALRENRLAATDDNGVYEIKELPAGRYQLSATKSSFWRHRLRRESWEDRPSGSRRPSPSRAKTSPCG